MLPRLPVRIRHGKLVKIRQQRAHHGIRRRPDRRRRGRSVRSGRHRSRSRPRVSEACWKRTREENKTRENFAEARDLMKEGSGWNIPWRGRLAVSIYYNSNWNLAFAEFHRI